ncbi:dimethyladenosine transferase [Capnocytophaga haemolytica]|jgi:dimethyladenosine transferase|uniref:Ribosomal RNA small subunit methyltransferase A n=1 Tax=Capnocytophaga haemolytica TaxID=45243 RepID=A0AAX2GUI9_9FLAO|nr:16S rRNA (adenine(1518)-N(6)/adenine(1519)-N(6))-dimethyltransferase RsmA [Capnocytophaga haemolytica]AMD85386.1 16S rRNA methyltransferase [Capnocytophaga haemolytica]SFO13378.1 dimethyladenosine transferase [Capnocytophaga haemolytica]SNV02155.1 Ribosomal RNA small subunit methyltransferase A [Capnocytophaga haemolytica]
MTEVRAKKHLGQHFLTDLNIAKKIADTLSLVGYRKVVEIGAGMGVLTQFLLEKNTEVHVIEIDKESVAYLNEHYPTLQGSILAEDFLKYDIAGYMGEPFAIIGNFPYNISTQIVFKLLELREIVPEFSGMFQKEVAERICEKAGSKTYGILSVLVQAFYEAEYLFTVSEHVFNPPPKVKSGVLRLRRKANYHLDCDEKLFFTVVKTAFNQRRKTLRNSLKSLLTEEIKQNPIFDKRPEQLSWEEFMLITKEISEEK